MVYGHADGVEHGAHGGEVFAARVVEVIADLGQLLDDGLVFGDLAVEHAQRIGFGATLAVRTHHVDDRLKRFTKGLVVAGAIGGGADGVELQRPAAQAELVEQSGEHVEHFGVAGGRFAAGAGRSDDLGADLVELAVASFLRTLAAELRADVIELLELADFVELVLDVGADDACGVFWAEGQRLRLLAGGAALVFPGEHFLRDDVGFFADAAREQLRVFEDGSANFVEVVAGEDVAHLRLDTVPEVGVGREKVASSADGSNHGLVASGQWLVASRVRYLPFASGQNCGHEGRKANGKSDLLLSFR